MRTIIFITFVFFLFACEKKELPVKKYDRGDVLTTQINMGSDYRQQVWFSLHDNRVVSSNLKSGWDLAFEASPDGSHILLNGSKAMKVYKTPYTALSEVSDTTGLGTNSKADVPSGNPDSTAIGDWQAGNVYIINRGYNESGILQGFYKLKIRTVTASAFTFEYAVINSAEIITATVTKDPDYNYVLYSLGDHSQIQLEPAKTSYDLCFTQYTHFFLNPYQYYQVTGVLSNSYNTRIALLQNKPFTDISITDTASCVFSTDRNTIGYDWKTFNLTTNIYTINPAMCYIIHDNKGFYYKLHFIDFLNSSGEKGFPKFEFKKL